MQKKIVCFSLILTLICVLIGGCIQETGSNHSNLPSNGGRILYVDKENYPSIQGAINDAHDNDTILVSQGTYYETIVIEKSIQLIAVEPSKAIITASEEHYNHPDFIQIKAQGCTIQGFTIRGDYPLTNASGISIFYSNNTVTQNNVSTTFYGIYLESDSENNTISYNTIASSQHGVYVSSSFNNVLHNWMINNTFGIYVRHGFQNSIFLNHISGNNWGIRLKGATNNQIYENQIQDNVDGVYSCCGAMQNTIFKNNFLNNSENAYDELPSSWSNNGMGNYWSDYLLKYPDAQSQDTIWDAPYNITGGDNQDRYPLVTPFSP